ncbi:MAG: FAD-dependent oxidoreductase [Gemmobacter sp.]|jgi:glycerol-3-phosphate dehydrogenase|nr:FAD-dependent oxidoreductase [Gemmobacter sp.]
MTEIHDAVVVGGGIIAAAAAQHLTAAGYRTLLAERGDYGSGTSSRTSRLQHCGLSYFSPAGNSIAAFILNPRFGLSCMELTRRAMRGRAEFVKSSPERVRPLTFVVPLTPDNAIPVWKARLAFKMMEIFDAGRVPLDLRVLSASQARAYPGLQGLADLGRIRGAITFTEHQFIWPERIVIDTIMKARDQGLEALNYSPVTGVSRDGEGWRVTMQTPGGPCEVRTRAVVNCAGVWVDEITAMTGANTVKLNSGAKGTNIAVRLPERFRGIGFDTVTSTGMAFYLIPWGDLHYIGPWDTPATGTRENFRASGDEIDAILNEMSLLFPEIGLTRKDVLYSWAGARPRTAREGQILGSMEVMEHDLTHQGMPNFFVFTGGLLMTHRDAGRRLAAAVARRLKPSGAPQPIDYSVRLVPDGDRVSETSVMHVVQNEQARSLAGILRRRLPVGWEADLGLPQAGEAARIAAPLLGWSPAETATEIERFRKNTILNFNPAIPA